MKNLKSIIQYECMTSIKYIWIFYAIQYALVGFITIIIGLVMGTFKDVGTNCLEINSLIYISILGVLGFKDDFKMLIQNGFTRSYIFTATLSMFSFISGIIALIDTTVGNLIHYFNNSYSTLYGSIYGYDNLFMNWLWLFLLYVTFCCLLYLIILIVNKTGKNISIILGVVFGGIVLLIVALFRYVFTGETIHNILEFLMKAMGFMADGTINYVFPAITLFALVAILGAGSYAIIRRTELK